MPGCFSPHWPSFSRASKRTRSGDCWANSSGSRCIGWPTPSPCFAPSSPLCAFCPHWVAIGLAPGWALKSTGQPCMPSLDWWLCCWHLDSHSVPFSDAIPTPAADKCSTFGTALAAILHGFVQASAFTWVWVIGIGRMFWSVPDIQGKHGFPFLICSRGTEHCLCAFPYICQSNSRRCAPHCVPHCFAYLLLPHAVCGCTKSTATNWGLFLIFHWEFWNAEQERYSISSFLFDDWLVRRFFLPSTTHVNQINLNDRDRKLQW